MYGDKKVMSLGNGLDPEELDYFAHVINKHLQGCTSVIRIIDKMMMYMVSFLVEKKACAEKEYLHE
jgi:hypothetical protein